MRGGNAKNFGWASGGSSILSEFGTLHMEFAYLSDITGELDHLFQMTLMLFLICCTGNPVYVKKVEKIREFVVNLERPKRLYPNYLHPKTGTSTNHLPY